MQAVRFNLFQNISKLFNTTLKDCQQGHIISKVLSTQHYTTYDTRKMSSSSPIYTVEYLSSKLQKELNAKHVDIEDLSNCGCGMKFDAVIVSPEFEGKPILQRQRLVNQTLAEEMKHIHAFTMRTLTPSQWKDSNNKQQGGET